MRPSRFAERRNRDMQQARKAMSQNRLGEAVKLLLPLGNAFRDDADVSFLLALCYEGLRQPREARRWAERSLQARKRVEPLLLLARLERRHGNTDKAVQYCDRAAEIDASNPMINVTKAGAYEEAGRFSEAKEALQPTVANYQVTGQAPPGFQFEWAKLLVQDKQYAEAIAVLDQLLAQPAPAGQQRAVELYLKAKACDRAKDYGAAMDAARAANEIDKVAYDPDLHTRQVTDLIANWSREAMARFPRSLCDSEMPVFVAGMPRSGTSLIDQIIDAHPLAAGVGELSDIENFAAELSREYDADKPPPECFGRYQEKSFTRTSERYLNHLKKLSAPGVQRVVNKSLGNNKLVGLLALLFPKTRIIHAIRDPRDVAISCFMGGFNNYLHAWTTQLDWVAHSWKLSWRMMEHWKKTLDIPILDVHYESLVANPEQEFPRLIEFLGLPWDDKCLEFHRSRRTVRTLSYDQVNRPLYTTSSGRHANFDAYLEGIDFPEYMIPTSAP